MAAEGGAHLAVMVVQEAHAALVVGVGLVLVLEHGDRPALGLGLDGLGVPVGALHQAHGDRLRTSGRECDQIGQVVAGVLEVGLDDDARVDVGELVLGQQLAEQLQGEVLGVVVLHVEVDVGAPVAGQPQEGAEAGLGLREGVVARKRVVEGGERRRLHADVDARERPEVVALEMVVGRPAPGGVHEDGQKLLDPPRSGRLRPR